MKLADAKKLMEADKEAVDFGITEYKLMERAAKKVAEAAAELAGPTNHSCAVFCGAGNNGGDGMGAAIEMRNKGFLVRVYLLGDSVNMSAESHEMMEQLERIGVRIEGLNASSPNTVDFIKSCGVIIDALFGTGLSREIMDMNLVAVRLINSSSAPVVSVDIASGVEADTGRILGEAVKADVTVTFTLAKVGHFVSPGSTKRGRLIVEDIGLPRKLVNQAASKYNAMTLSEMFIPERNQDTAKWDYGRVLVVAGSVGCTGAPIMASRAAVRTGAGLVFLAVPDDVYDICAVKSDEVMVTPFPSRDGCFSTKAIDKIKEKLVGCNVCLLGPGLGRRGDTTALVHELVHTCKVPLIIDADGINAVSVNIDVLKEATCPVIITPHEREFIRMGGDLSEGRLKGAIKFAQQYNCAVLLKGSGTITALPNGAAFVNTTGNAGMAKGGSGDVLAGMVAALIGQKYPPAQAAVYGAFLHGLAGDLCANELTEYAMTPMDMLNYVPQAFKLVTRK